MGRESTHVGVPDLGIPGCLAVMQGRAGEEAFRGRCDIIMDSSKFGIIECFVEEINTF